MEACSAAADAVDPFSKGLLVLDAMKEVMFRTRKTHLYYLHCIDVCSYTSVCNPSYAYIRIHGRTSPFTRMP